VHTAELEELLPVITTSNLSAEDPSTLTPRHFAQLIQLGQAALDYLVVLVSQTGDALVRRQRCVFNAAGWWGLMML